MIDVNVAERAETAAPPFGGEVRRSFFRKIRDHITLLDGIRFCAAFNAGGLVALVGYAGLLVGLDRLGLSIVVFYPMVATFTFGLLFAGVATTSWFASRHYMTDAVANRHVEPTVSPTAASISRALRLQSITTNFVAASYVTFVVALAGLPMLLNGFGA